MGPTQVAALTELQGKATANADAASARAAQLAAALSRERSEGERAAAAATAKIESLTRTQTAEAEAGTRARSELGKARSRVAKLEVRGWGCKGGSFLMSEACPGKRSYVGLARAAGGARASRCVLRAASSAAVCRAPRLHAEPGR